MAVGKPLHLRLFLEGIEVPVVAAQVSANVNAPASAAIQIIPLDEAMSLKPRTMVHAFWLDSQNTKLQGLTPKDAAIFGDNLQGYRVLFTGETIGFSYVSQPNSRAVILQCVDFSSYWDAAHATAIEYGPGGNLFTNTAALYGSDASHFDDIVNQQAERLVEWISQTPQTEGLRSVSGLAGGIIHMLEAMGGVPNHFKGINDFFTIAELRCRLLSQIFAEENDNTAASLLREKVFMQWLKNGLQNMGQQVTFRDMMKMLFQYIYYESVPNPVAKFDEAIEGAGTEKGALRKVSLNQNPTALQVMNDLREVISAESALLVSENLQAVVDRAKDHIKLLNKSIDRLKNLSKSVPKASPAIQRASAKILAAVVSLERMVVHTSGGPDFRSPRDSAQEALDFLLNSEDSSFTRGKGKSKDRTARFGTQIIRPDCWFAAPPRCNVIFPEQYTQLSYDRIYIQEVTRVLISTYNALVGKDSLLADRILAPNVGTDVQALTKRVGKSSYRALLPHELHTGIIPRQEWLSDRYAFSTNSAEKNRVRGARLSWADRIALFHFFKYRFGPRQASLAGPFNAFLVCGFPALVITKPYNLKDLDPSQESIDDALANAVEYGAPSHLVGMVGALNHNLDQSGGTSQISLHHVRQTLSVDDEFLNIFSEVKEPSKKKILKVVLKLSEILDNPKLLKFLSDATPQEDPPEPPGSLMVRTAIEVTDVIVSSETISGGQRVVEERVQKVPRRTELPLSADADDFVVRGKIEGAADNVFIPNPPGKITVGKEGVFGRVLGVEVLDPSYTELDVYGRLFQSVALYEEIDVPISAPLPVEEIIRPSWFSPKYANDRIGTDIYQPFFGCGSIIDETSVSGLGAETVSTNPNAPVMVDPSRDIGKMVAEFSELESSRAKNTIQRAANFIAFTYGLVQSRGLDVDDFIRSFNDRSIASLTDLLGSPDLQIDASGDGRPVVISGTVGFHSFSLHEALIEKGNLAGLVDDPNTQLKRMNMQGKEGTIPPKYDVRKEKRDRVLAYYSALSKGPAFRG